MKGIIDTPYNTLQCSNFLRQSSSKETFAMSLVGSIFFKKDPKESFSPIPLDAAEDFVTLNKSVVIIGAGTAGLFAANALKKMGVTNVKILEASSTFGGRVRKLDGFADLPIPLSMGAEWIHFPDPQIVQDMLVFDDVNVLQEEEFIPFDPQDIRLDKTYHNWIRFLYKETKFKKISWHVYLEKYVYSHVQDQVLYNKVVTNIDYSGDKVSLTTKDGSKYSADRIICTIPLAVLKANPPSFTPPLPAFKAKVLEQADMPPAIRCYMEMKEQFYPTVSSPNGIWKALMDDDDLAIAWDPLLNKGLPSDKHVLGFVAVGHKNAGPLSQLKTEKELLEKILDILDDMYNGQARVNFTGRFKTIDWTNEPFARGSYTFPHSKQLCLDLGASIGNGKVLFAGEHTDPEFATYVHGAARQGRRAAVEAVSLPGTYPLKKDANCFKLPFC